MRPLLLFIPWFKFETIPIPGLPNGVGLHVFGLLVAIGLILGVRISEWRAKRLGLKPQVIADFIGHVVIIGFIGSHIFDRVFYYPERVLREPWDLLMPWRSLSSFGGFLFAVVGAFVWKYRRKLNITIPLDQVAFGMPFAWFFGRMGCFMVHDHPGKLTDFFLAVNDYHYNELPVGPRHDLGLYEVLWSAVVAPLFYWLDRKPRPHGFYIGLIAVLYSPFRFGLDFLRDADATYLGLTPGHYSSVFCFLLGLGVLWRVYKHPVTSIPPELLESAPTNPTRSTKSRRAKAART
jgi:phosphatidylglycerol:prolipoprotein diacylglycerol transferase